VPGISVFEWQFRTAGTAIWTGSLFESSNNEHWKLSSVWDPTWDHLWRTFFSHSVSQDERTLQMKMMTGKHLSVFTVKWDDKREEALDVFIVTAFSLIHSLIHSYSHFLSCRCLMMLILEEDARQVVWKWIERNKSAIKFTKKSATYLYHESHINTKRRMKLPNEVEDTKHSRERHLLRLFFCCLFCRLNGIRTLIW